MSDSIETYDFLPDNITPKAQAIYNGCNGKNFPDDIAAQLPAHLEKRNEGRMSLFTLDRAEAIIDALRDGSTEKDACEKAGISRNTFKLWCRRSPEFMTVITQAQEDRADSMVDDGFSLLGDVNHTGRDGMAALRKAEQMARYRMDVAKCLNFRKYGDKKQSLNVNANVAVTPADVSKWFNP